MCVRVVVQLTEIDAYINAAPGVARPILHKIRAQARKICPDAQEVISYKLPALRQHRVFFYYAAFKNHIGLYPPVKQDEQLLAELAPYRGPKGNLQFPYAEDIPYDLIGKVIAALNKEYAVKK
jgi:uncharacterized protein YdhG (YjbR/CyaY superfamily)